MKQHLLLSHANDNSPALQEGAGQSQSGFILNLCAGVCGEEGALWAKEVDLKTHILQNSSAIHHI